MPNLESLEIRPAKNRGFTVTHHFKPRAVSERGAMRGGLSMRMPEPETHSFGAGEHQALTAHLAKALGLKNMAEEAQEAGQEGGGE